MDRARRGILGGVGLLFVSAALSGAFPAVSALAGGSEDPASESAEAERKAAIDGLGSPYFAEREAAVSNLIGDLPAARPTVLAAFSTSTGPRRLGLVRVLAKDGSEEAVDALLKTLVSTEDPTLGGAIRRALVDNAEAVSAAVERYRDASGRLPPRAEEMRDLLRRARVEALFLSKKSRSGSTGYYHGQFDELKADREMALQVLAAMLEDRAFKWPGEVPSGSYRFLRPPPILVDRVEVRDLAANGLAELATPADDRVLAGLDVLAREYGAVARAREEATNLGCEEGTLFDVLVTILARNSTGDAQDEWQQETVSRLRWLKMHSLHEEAASLCLRLGDYDQAISLYRAEIVRARQRGQITPIPFYNIACAWAVRSRGSPTRAAEYRHNGILALSQSIDAGYPDWPWMEQDRDLDALRTEPEYPVLLEKVKALFRLPPKDGPLPPGPGAQPRPPPSMGDR